MDRLPSAAAEEPLRLSLLLTALQVCVFFSFILISCFESNALRAAVPGLDLPLSFVFGLGVIACGTLLTVAYVIRTNAMES